MHFFNAEIIAVHKLRSILSLGFLSVACFLLPAHADDLVVAHTNQSAFDQFANDVTAAFDYRPLQPATVGRLGVSVSGFGSVTHIHDKAAYKAVTGHNDSNIYIGGVEADAGLPGGLDVGAFLAGVSDNSITLYGARLRYALMKGSLLLPSVVIGGHYTGAAGIKDFKYDSWGTDVTLAKSLPLLTPYAGLGYVWGRLSPRHGIALKTAHADRVKGFAGLRISVLPFVRLNAEYERLGSTNIYTLRAGVSI